MNEVIIKYKINEIDDYEKFLRHIKADSYYFALEKIREFLRNKVKYEEFEHEETRKVVEEIYDSFFEILKEEDIEL